MKKSINNRRREQQMERRRWFFGTILLIFIAISMLAINIQIERGGFRELASSMREWNEARINK